jgi:hypothetical protein
MADGVVMCERYTSCPLNPSLQIELDSAILQLLGTPISKNDKALGYLNICGKDNSFEK